MVQEVEATAKTVNYKFSGIDQPKNPGGLYSLQWAEFVVLHVKGIQEQQQEIAELKKRIEQLEKLLRKTAAHK